MVLGPENHLKRLRAESGTQDLRGGASGERPLFWLAERAEVAAVVIESLEVGVVRLMRE
ncbi:MAG: hypothetical protein AAFX65_05335 [Cyanobacteria bacterium J06638_7]